MKQKRTESKVDNQMLEKPVDIPVSKFTTTSFALNSVGQEYPKKCNALEILEMTLVVAIMVMIWSTAVNALPFMQSMMFTAIMNNCSDRTNRRNVPAMANENQDFTAKDQMHSLTVELAIFFITFLMCLYEHNKKFHSLIEHC